MAVADSHWLYTCVSKAELKVAREKVSALALAHEKVSGAPARRSIFVSRFRSLNIFFSLFILETIKANNETIKSNFRISELHLTWNFPVVRKQSAFKSRKTFLFTQRKTKRSKFWSWMLYVQ
jgi:hypothetical protein